MVAEDGDRIYGYLTDEWYTGLDVELRIGSEFAPEVVVDEIAEYSDFEDQYQAAMEVFYRLRHHQMIYMEEWFEMGLQSITIWVEAGEEFGVVFITDQYGAFEPDYDTTDSGDLLVETANYYLADDEGNSYV